MPGLVGRAKGHAAGELILGALSFVCAGAQERLAQLEGELDHAVHALPPPHRGVLERRLARLERNAARLADRLDERAPAGIAIVYPSPGGCVSVAFGDPAHQRRLVEHAVAEAARRGGHREGVRQAGEHVFVSHPEASILHADLDSFYASVEQRDNPRLRGRPVIVGAGVVLAASYEAKARGVRTAMGGHHARRLCPEAVVVPPRMSAYSEASKAVFKLFEDTAPVVEGLSIDEAFLDVRGLDHISGTPVEIAARLRRRVREEAGLPITVGVARTKFLAKVASAVAKPDGLLVVPSDRELEFLHPLPVEALWGVGRVTAEKLHQRGITTVAQVAQLAEGELVGMLGRASGRHLHALAHNHDPRPVETRRRRRSIGAQRALGRRRRSQEELAGVLIALVDRVARRLRTARRVCRTVILRMRFEDFSRATRSYTLLEPTDQTHALVQTAHGLLRASAPLIERRGLTLIGITLTNLTDVGAIQLVLPFDRARDLDAVLDRVRDRFGAGAITRGVLVGRDPGVWVPLLPD